MKGLLVPSTVNKMSDNLPSCIHKKDDHHDVEGSSIKVSISQDSLHAKSPHEQQTQRKHQRKSPKPETGQISASYLTRSLPSFAEKHNTSAKKLNRKGSRHSERFQR